METRCRTSNASRCSAQAVLNIRTKERAWSIGEAQLCPIYTDRGKRRRRITQVGPIVAAVAVAIDIETIIERLGSAGAPGENTGSLPVPGDGLENGSKSIAGAAYKRYVPHVGEHHAMTAVIGGEASISPWLKTFCANELSPLVTKTSDVSSMNFE